MAISIAWYHLYHVTQSGWRVLVDSKLRSVSESLLNTVNFIIKQTLDLLLSLYPQQTPSTWTSVWDVLKISLVLCSRKTLITITNKQFFIRIKVTSCFNSSRLQAVHPPCLQLSGDCLNVVSSLFPCLYTAHWDSFKKVSNLVGKRRSYTWASYEEGCSLEKHNDCLRAPWQCLSRWWSTCRSFYHVCSSPLCLLAHLHILCFVSSFTLPSLHFLSYPSSLLPFVLLFASRSAKPHIPYSGLHFTTVACTVWRIRQYNWNCSPCKAGLSTHSWKWESFESCISLPYFSFYTTHLHTHTHTQTQMYEPANRTVVSFCLWWGKAISRLFQSSVIRWNVSLSGVCFMCLSPQPKPFWETENKISYDLLWYKSKLSAVNPIHSHSCLCVSRNGNEISFT